MVGEFLRYLRDEGRAAARDGIFMGVELSDWAAAAVALGLICGPVMVYAAVRVL